MFRKIDTAEVKKHRNPTSPWIIIHNEIYDVSSFLSEHPGGAESLLDYAGKDATEAFEDIGHSKDARDLMKKFKIGFLPPKERCTYVDKCSCQLAPDASRPPQQIVRSDRRVDTIIVPIEKRQSSKCFIPCENNEEVDSIEQDDTKSSNLKWYLLALALAVIVGISVKKMTSS